MDKILQKEHRALKLFGIKILEWNTICTLKETIKEDTITKKDYAILEEYRKNGFIKDSEFKGENNA